MSETAGRTLWYKLRYTPVSDFLRGEWTARLDSARQLENSGLPEPVCDFLTKVVKHTRVWRLEKAAVLEELIAHFTDGLQAGVAVEQLIADFGDPVAAAKLIRRAVRRNRPLPWQVVRFVGWCGMGILGFYLLYSIHFFVGKPSIKTDYVARLNERTNATPVEQRAWPLYRKALLALEAALPDSRLIRSEDVGPGHQDWPQLAAFLGANREQLRVIRQAAALPEFGFVLGESEDVDAAAAVERGSKSEISVGNDVAGMSLPGLTELRKLSNLLAADNRLAREQGDARRGVEDIEALLGLARQLRENRVLLLDMVAISIHTRAIEQLHETLRQTPALLTEQDLTTFAHRLSHENSAADLLSMETERATFEDILQRSFTDDGNGDGRLTPEGVEYVMGFSSSRLHSGVYKILGPAAGLMISSRRELSAEYDRLTSLAEANFRFPIRVANWEPFSAFDDDNDVFPFALGGERLARRFIPVYWRFHATAERLLGYRDGTVVAISLELYRRRNQRYPATLDALSTALLPQIPADRVTGEPVKFQLLSGTPVVYSVGVDRDDDGGRPAFNKASLSHANLGLLQGGEAPDGDWVLYPLDLQP